MSEINGPISIYFCRNVSSVILYQDCSSHTDSSKYMAAARERGLFSLYIYIENLKNLLVRNHWTDLQQCSFGGPLPRLFKPFWFVKKHGRQGAGLIFPIYLYRKLKNLIVRNHWTDFHIILQKCSFGYPLPRLFKPLGFVKKHGRRGQCLFSLYIYIENLKNLLVRNRFPYNFAEMFLW